MSPPLTDAELFQEAARRSNAREPFVLCTVTGTARSAPRDAGAKMLVAPDGAISGTVGGVARGGQREAPLERAAEPLALDAPSPSDELGMKCGGEVTVFLDVVRPAPRLVLYGAGHVGERVASIAGEVGLQAVVVDDRPRFATRDRFPKAAEVRCEDLGARPLGGIQPGAQDFVVILTRCHALDEGVLEAALATSARYIGLIGSRRKVALILRSIAGRSGCDPRLDPRLHAPIGLKLGDKTPGEIAISILAEILLLKSGGELAHSKLPAKDAQLRRA
jgi:xanthine dehydrogenase accessory factor